MNASYNPYETLCRQLKNRFTIESDGKDYSLGEYMQFRALVRRETPTLPVRAHVASGSAALIGAFRYVQDKLTVRTPPVKDKTMRRFPLRSSFAAALSAVTLCSLLFVFTVFGATAVISPDEKKISYAESNGSQPEQTTETDAVADI